MIVLHRSSRRRGLVSVVLVAALLILAIVSAGLLRLAFLRKADLAMSERRLQAEWLVESGLDRTSARLGSKRDFTGETWTIPAAELGGRAEGVVTIAVEPVAGLANRRTIRVQADYPKAGDRRARHSRALTIELSPESKSNPDRKGEAPR